MELKPLYPLTGLPQMGDISQYLPSTDRKFHVGGIVTFQDSFWGGGELIYAKAADTITQFMACSLSGVYNSSATFLDGSTGPAWELSATRIASTAGLNLPIGIALTAMTSGQYGWFAIAASAFPVQCSAAPTANAPLYISATVGRLFATQTNGKMILNLTCLDTGAATKTATAVGGVSGGTKIILSDVRGVFVGQAISGTGIGASSVVSSIDADNHTVVSTVANSAAPSGTITFTNNAGAAPYYAICNFNRPAAQGQIV